MTRTFQSEPTPRRRHKRNMAFGFRIISCSDCHGTKGTMFKDTDGNYHHLDSDLCVAQRELEKIYRQRKAIK